MYNSSILSLSTSVKEERNAYSSIILFSLALEREKKIDNRLYYILSIVSLFYLSYLEYDKEFSFPYWMFSMYI